MDIKELKNKYENDTDFHCLVDMLYMLFYKNQFTFEEVKSALVFAMNKFFIEVGAPAFENIKDFKEAWNKRKISKWWD